MNSIVLIIVLPLVVAFFVFVIVAFVRFDARLAQIFENDRNRWRSLGSPMGFFWRPSEKTKFMEGTMSRNEIFFVFLAGGLKMPDHDVGLENRSPSGQSEDPTQERQR